jgi:hypothetical protein
MIFTTKTKNDRQTKKYDRNKKSCGRVDTI